MFKIDELCAIWRRLEAEDAADGMLSYGTRRFAQNASEELETLAQQLADHSWRPAMLTPFVLPDKKRRQLHIPGVADRIVARAILQRVTPVIDPVLGAASYAYRPGLGVPDAVQAVVLMRDSGYGWALRADVSDCFPNIDKEIALTEFKLFVRDEYVIELVDALLHRRTAASGGAHEIPGLPQGCPLSPLLCNLVLRHLDEELQRRGFPVVRYADDFVVGATSEREAGRARRLAEAKLKEIGMQLGEKKTLVRSYEEGFTFLGEDFGTRYPPVIPEHRVREPKDKVVYAAVQGGRVRVKSGRLTVQDKKDEVKIDVPTGQVGRIVLFGSVGLSVGARSWAMGTDVDVVFASRSGNYLGSLHSASQPFRPARLDAQLALRDTPKGLELARAFIRAKINNQRTVLLRFNRSEASDDVAAAIDTIQALRPMLADATSPSEIMGIEGAAAAQYFKALGLLAPDELRFTGRSRRPPRDVFNAALSYLYTILLGECVTALHASGLDPGIGLLHSRQGSRPSLALDLLEEFRPLIVDQAVMQAARQGRFGPQHARKENTDGVLLTKAGKEALLTAYEQRLNRFVKGALPDYAGSYRRHIYRQAMRLMVSIMNPDAEWTGLSWR